ncbi:MAG: carbon-nitrogen hydrolase [Planctomycetales bacterium]|nr:carbon-nitrogen hydrolase [Planctomycetales bacterium]
MVSWFSLFRKSIPYFIESDIIPVNALPTQVQIGLLQFACESNPDRNQDHAEQLIRQAARDGAQIICLPELYRTPYFCQTEDHRHFSLAESIPGPTTERLSQLARDLSVVILASLFEKRAEGLYHNTSVVLDADGRTVGKYRKMHIPDDPAFYEKFYFTPGDLGFRSFTTRFARIGTLVCWDQWFPEAARLTAMTGADLLVYPTAIGWHPSEREEFGATQQGSWETIQRSHAIANGCFVAAINRIGHETVTDTDGRTTDGIVFWGHSFVSDPNGRLVALASDDQEEIIMATLDRDHIDLARTHWPFLRDRRIDAYGALTKRFLDSAEQEG